MGDEEPYLENAISFKENGLRTLFREDGYDDKYWPLHAITTSPWASVDFEFFGRARIINYIIGILIFILNYLFVLKFFSKQKTKYLIALVSGLLLARNPYFLQNVSAVSVDPLFTLFTLLFFYTLIDLERNRSTIRYFLIGVIVALAYLTKGTATLLLGALLVSPVLLGKKLFKDTKRPLLYIIVSFVIVSAPLFIRNIKFYSNPLYSYSQNVTMWLDSWDQAYESNNISTSTGLFSYLRTHSRAEVTHRIFEGLNKQTELVINLLSPLDGFIFGGALFLGLLFLGFLLLKRRDLIVSTMIVSFILFFLSFSWYAEVVNSARFYIPILPLVLNIVAFVLVHTVINFFKNYEKYVVNILTILIIFLVGLKSFSSTQVSLYPQNFYPEKDQQYEVIRSWVEENIKGSEDIYLHGPDHNYQFEWQTRTNNLRKRIPPYETQEEFDEFLEKEKIKYVLLTHNLTKERDKIIEPCMFPVESMKRCAPYNWELILYDESSPQSYALYKVY